MIKLRPSSLEIASSQKLLLGRVPNISHLRIFGCRVWVPVPESQCHTIGAHRQEGIYVGFDSPSIIRYVNPSTGSLLRARFANCRFEEDIFPSLRGGATSQSASQGLIFKAPETLTMYSDPRTSLVETQVAKILHLQRIADQTPDGFNDATRITRNPINEALNVPARVSVPNTIIVPPISSTGKRTCGRDKQPRKRKAVTDTTSPSMPIAATTNLTGSMTPASPSMINVNETPAGGIIAHEQTKSKLNTELSVMYCGTGDVWDRASIDIDDSFIGMIV